MSYCRGDVYAYHDGHGWEVILKRVLVAPHTWVTKHYYAETASAFRKLLLDLIKQGHDVPQSAVDRIEKELNEGKWPASGGDNDRIP